MSHFWERMFKICLFLKLIEYSNLFINEIQIIKISNACFSENKIVMRVHVRRDLLLHYSVYSV